MSELPHIITGQAPMGAVGLAVVPKVESLSDKVAMWYSKPLREMHGDQAFICLAICFPLYEKYLRLSGAMPKDDKFHQTHEIFRLVADHFNTDPDTTYLIWASWRNGLLHRAMPKEKATVNWALDGHLDVPVKKAGTNITINPWLLRDRILDVVEANRGIWKDTQAPLMDVYEVTPLK